MGRTRCPVFRPGDPRIEETLRRGGGVGVDLSHGAPHPSTPFFKMARKGGRVLMSYLDGTPAVVVEDRKLTPEERSDLEAFDREWSGK